jgi:uncharacterized membrane protein (DUF4010 family)
VRQSESGVVLATSVMYLRLLIIIFVFSRDLATALAAPLLALSLLGLAMALAWYWTGRRRSTATDHAVAHGNPLELTTAATFAVLFVAISIASAWAMQRFGSAGVYALAAIVGVSDIDPFVLNLAQGDRAQIAIRVAADAVLIATSSNNLAKAIYAIVYSSARMRLAPAAMAVLSACGVAAAVAL